MSSCRLFVLTALHRPPVHVIKLAPGQSSPSLSQIRICIISKFHIIHKSTIHTCITGSRLNNFKVMVGNQFSPTTTGISEISTWMRCVNVTGKWYSCVNFKLYCQNYPQWFGSCKLWICWILIHSLFLRVPQESIPVGCLPPTCHHWEYQWEGVGPHVNKFWTDDGLGPRAPMSHSNGGGCGWD